MKPRKQRVLGNSYMQAAQPKPSVGKKKSTAIPLVVGVVVAGAIFWWMSLGPPAFQLNPYFPRGRTRP